MEKQLHLLTGSYALNALTNGERSDFERHALTDPQTLEEVRSLSETAALLAYGTPAETPPPALKADVMAAIRNTRQLPSSSVVRDISSARGTGARKAGTTQSRSRWVPAISAAAALAIFAGVGVGGWVAGQNSSDTEMKQQLAQAQAQQQAMLAIMSSPDAKMATTTLSDGGTVTVASSGKANKAAVMVDGMPPLPEGKTYELWFISAAGAVPAGLMDSPKAPAMQVLNGELGGATHIGITVEPAGGSAKPTTTPILVQEI
ncbi:anti-sigma factor [Arthrobacter sp. HY1533]|uniref:anti-sigma factor n=1 Tax=Arthrobacter sp. HY1533 TaxID=2970919 RepID=UPI0022BA0BF7|nr:anti-sigma factor [Arthrobacter sp. HY1533]